MSITTVKKEMQKNFEKMTKDSTHLFEVELDKDALWDLYLDSFPSGCNEIYRKRREHDCSACKSFIKKIGNVVCIKDNIVQTIFDFETDDYEYAPVMSALSEFIKSKPVTDVWVNKFKKIGIDINYEHIDGTTNTYEHLYLDIPVKFVTSSTKSEGDIRGDFRATHDVFKRSLEEITEDSLLTILELIASNTLYKGEEWKHALTEILKYKKDYVKLADEEKHNFAWEKSVIAGPVIGRIRNHSIGVLLTDVSEGMDLDDAVRRYEKITAPVNYQRPNAIFTQKMLEEAKKKIEELGYMDSLQRRYANLGDININDILYSNKDAGKRIIGTSVFDEMSADVAINPKKFSKIEEVTIDKFVNDILPTAQELEVLFENRHVTNMVSIIAPVNAESPSMFKWDNSFSWAYSGNITDSNMKQNVKNAGGDIEGDLRFSIQWNDDEYNPNDFDAHCIEPSGNHIYYGDKCSRITFGKLDVDITGPRRGTPAVENITWANIDRMCDGTYKFYVKNYYHRGGRSGFKAEIEFNGEIHTFEHGKELRQGEEVPVAEVTLKNGIFTIKEKLPSNVSSKEMWGLKTNQFVPVSVVCFSPNYWGENNVGNRHYMFMLKDCVNPESPSGFFNEYLKQELVTHKRVFEALSSKMRVQDTEDQLSGIGFSSTKRNEIIVKAKGSIERVIKVKF